MYTQLGKIGDLRIACATATGCYMYLLDEYVPFKGDFALGYTFARDVLDMHRNAKLI